MTVTLIILLCILVLCGWYCVVGITLGLGTLEISGGIYNTAGTAFLQGDSWRKDTNIITSKTQASGSLA